MVSNESVKYNDTLKDSGAGDKSVEELQVKVELQRLNNHMPEEDQTYQEDGDDEDGGDQATDQPPDLTDYYLVQERDPWKRMKPLRIDNGKSVKMPLGGNFKLSLKDYPVRDCDVERMSKVPYANAVESLMYLMVCTRPDIAYAATLQHVVALSTTEAEYMALTKAVKEGIWLMRLLEELVIELNTMVVNCDNQGTIHLSRNHVFHERTKHINVRYHFIREVLEAKTVKVLKANIKPKVEIVEFSLYFSHMEFIQASIQERAKHNRDYDRRMNDKMMHSKEGKVDLSKSLNAGLVITKGSRTDSDKQDTNSTSRNDTDALDVDIRLKSNKEPGLSSRPGLHSMTPATSNTGLISNPVSQQPCIPPNTDDWICLFQPMFDEYFNPLTTVVSPVQKAATLRAEVLVDSLVSTFIYQDALSTRSSSNMRQIHTSFEHLGRWTKDYLIANVVGDSSRSANPTEKHLQVMKWIFRYLKGTTNTGLWYSKDTDISLTAYADADHAEC
uniref:Retrovirus-related Pol polyprotein from transposon TNT 1-94 n=1 Tax=Tanacetum cinerariifolium TaxID=118510 RepID=A0A699HKS5_TANCI|nr:retrovirus-related Pol polyprotein from transposon TNT 1-94 [Tanacetum cinerariifolium]